MSGWASSPPWWRLSLTGRLFQGGGAGPYEQGRHGGRADFGYDPDHPDLKGVVTQARDFTGGTEARDNVGHGTHVASIVAGAGEGSVR
ncbi:S8 family serine peptidase [Nonomuraea harbinensis]|nr:S8 family serine peptidase [Nonomuraea harbinensis]